MHPTLERSGVGSNLAIALGLAALVALMVIDLVTELGVGTSKFHVLVETSAIVAGATAVVGLVRRMRELSRETHTLREHLSESRADGERWARQARNLIDGLGAAIDDQLESWHLTVSEKEIALLLLKGLEHKEIAVLRGVSENTVRQQAGSLYRKAGLGGRHELAAFFLEDLLGPRSAVKA